MRLLSVGEEAHLGALAAIATCRSERASSSTSAAAASSSPSPRGPHHLGRERPVGAVRMTRRFLRGRSADPARAPRPARPGARTPAWESCPRPAAAMSCSGSAARCARWPACTSRLRPGPAQAPRPAPHAGGRHGRARAPRGAPRAQAPAHPGLKAERADIILAGAITVEELMALRRISAPSPCAKRGVRDGILLQRNLQRRGSAGHDGAALHQPRAVLARVQSPRARGGPGPHRAAARARQVPRHLQLEPGRVLHGPRGRPQAARADAGEPAPGPDGLTARETLAAISERVHELVGAQHRCFLEEIQPLLAAEGVRILRPEDLDAGAAPLPRPVLQARAAPGADAARDRPRPSVPASGQSLALPRGLDPPGRVLAPAARLARRGPHPGPRRAPLRRPARAARPTRLRAARGRDSPAPAAPLPRLRGHLLPRHPRHARRGVRGQARPRRRSPHEHRGGPARAAHGRRRAPAVRGGPARGGAGGAGRRARAERGRPVPRRGLHRLLRPVPALRRGEPAPAQGPAAPAAPGARLRERPRRLDRRSGPATSSPTTRTSRSTP